MECPGAELSFESKTACSRGGYIDTNHDELAKPPAYNAVENAEWLNPPRGRYRIKVNLFDFRGRPQRDVPITVVVKCGNQEPRSIQGHIDREKQTLEIADVDYPSCAVTPR